MTKYRGFTLVELIVVITILIILGTIGFVSLIGYSLSARDSSRIENLSNLYKGLTLFQIKAGTYPIPENPISITASGTPIGYQGFAKDLVGSIAKISPGGTKDILDSTMYTTYSVNTNQTKMQVMAFLEDGSSVSSTFVPTVYAGSGTDYSKRYPVTRGDTLGILLGNSGSGLNQPVQEITSLTGIELFTSTGGLYNGILTNNRILTGTGPILWELTGRFDNTIGTYPQCDTPNIKLPNGQIWALCNVGAITAWTNQTFNSSTGTRNNSINSWAGGLYQWGNNAEISLTFTGATGFTCTNIANSYNTTIFRIGAIDWCNAQSDELWGDITRTNLSRKGPCELGYHVPTQSEWESALSSITGKSSGLIATDIPFLQNTLKLPMSGYRNYFNASFANQGYNGLYWSSSSLSTNSYYISFGPLGTYPPDFGYRAAGYSVRCIKN